MSSEEKKNAEVKYKYLKNLLKHIYKKCTSLLSTSGNTAVKSRKVSPTSLSSTDIIRNYSVFH